MQTGESASAGSCRDTGETGIREVHSRNRGGDRSNGLFGIATRFRKHMDWWPNSTLNEGRTSNKTRECGFPNTASPSHAAVISITPAPQSRPDRCRTCVVLGNSGRAAPTYLIFDGPAGCVECWCGRKRWLLSIYE